MLRANLVIALALGLALPSFAAGWQNDNNNQDKKLDIRSSVGDLHVGSDADAQKVGLPLYPGARVKSNGENDDKVNLGLLTEAFGIKLVVASFVSEDAPAKVVDFYRDRLKKYGKVLECHTHNHGGDVDAHEDKDSDEPKALKCEGDNTGPVTELKAGTENNQHVVAVEPNESGKGAKFALVYVHTPGKMGTI